MLLRASFVIKICLSMVALRFIGQRLEVTQKSLKCWYKLNAISKREIRY